jgi:hypothetical protein
LEGETATLLLKCPLHPAGFLYQKGPYQVVWPWWTLFINGWNFKNIAMLLPGNCNFMDKTVILMVYASIKCQSAKQNS